jgi:PAS domain S-box-containing protein
MWRAPPSRGEWIEGLGALALFALTVVFVETYPTGSWLSFSPGILLLPPLVWLTARCPPAFPIAGAFVASILIICAITCGLGRFGDAGVAIIERVRGAQAAVATGTIFTLGLTALFAQRKEAEAGLRESQGQLAKKSAALARLHDVGSRLWLKRDLRAALEEILAGAIELMGAEMGTIRILDATRGVLKIETHRGFKQDFIDTFAEVPAAGNSPCGRASQSGERMVVDDVEADELFAPFRALARAAGFRAVQSTPIMSREGALLGTLATHFRSAHKPADQDLRLLDLYVRQAADIVGRHNADDALRESEERLRLTQMRTGIGIWDWNLRTGRLACTPQLEAIFGLGPGSVHCYADFRDRVHPDDIDGVEAKRHAAVSQHETFESEFRIIRPDGQIRWVLAAGGAFYDEATSEPVRFLGNIADITERKQAQLALDERNAQLALAGKAARVGSYAFNPRIGLVKVSEGYAVIHGLPEGTTETTIGLWQTRVHPDDLARVEELRSRSFGQRQHDYALDYRIIRRHGDIRWIDSRNFVSYDDDGQPVRVIGINIDVTERKQTEALLQESKTRLSDALAAGQVVAFEWDAATGRSQRSENADRIMGLARDGRFLRQVHADDRKNFTTRIDGLCADNPSYALSFRFVRSDGRQAWLEETAKGEFDAAGKLLRIKGLTRDITERKELEDHKNTLISELDHRVKNVLATVSTVASRTQEASSSMAEFVTALDGRIKSMATTHELLSTRRWHGIPLADLVRRELAPYATPGNTRIDGPDVVLSAEGAQTLAMVFHELATNAAKFGAISVNSGRVSVRWRFRPNGHAESWLCIQWEERGGPRVVPPTRSGFGTSVVRELIPYELGGTVELVHPPEGVRCKAEIPAHWLSASTPPTRNAADTVPHALR